MTNAPRRKPLPTEKNLPWRRLDHFLDHAAGGARVFATTVGVHESDVCRWRSGARVPAERHRAKIETLTGIPAASWPTRVRPTGAYRE